MLQETLERQAGSIECRIMDGELLLGKVRRGFDCRVTTRTGTARGRGSEEVWTVEQAIRDCIPACSGLGIGCGLYLRIGLDIVISRTSGRAHMA